MGIVGSVNTDEGFFTVSHGKVLAPGDWHHVVLTYDGQEIALFVDGEKVNSGAARGFIFSSTAPVKLGTIHAGKSLFEGALDEVRIYDRALPPAEIRAHLQRRKYAAQEPGAAIAGGKEGP